MIVGTTHFETPSDSRYQPYFTPKSKRMQSTLVHVGSRDENNRAKVFTVTIDPTGNYTLGKSCFTTFEVLYGIHYGAFPEGMEFMSATGRVRIMNGKLKYTRNKENYKLPEVRL